MISVAIVGTISNVENVLEKDLKQLITALAEFNVSDIFLVESDSIDKTSILLKKLEKKYSNLKYAKLGNLKNEIPDRIERIRHCRNHYVNWIRENYAIKIWDYVIVVDLDGMNKKISSAGINSCFLSEISWDAVFANQKYGYYDIYALRHATWMPYDCFRVLSIMKKKLGAMLLTRPIRSFLFKRIYFDSLRRKLIYEKMLKLHVNSDWIQVDSAFGGLAMYKVELFLKNDYSVISERGNIRSEHIDFHKKCIKDGYKLYINPKLINSTWNEYNVNKNIFVRQSRSIFYEIKAIILKITK
jgi:hypothetical protein